MTIIIITGLELANTVAKATNIFCYSSKKHSQIISTVKEQAFSNTAVKVFHFD